MVVCYCSRPVVETWSLKLWANETALMMNTLNVHKTDPGSITKEYFRLLCAQGAHVYNTFCIVNANYILTSLEHRHHGR